MQGGRRGLFGWGEVYEEEAFMWKEEKTEKVCIGGENISAFILKDKIGISHLAIFQTRISFMLNHVSSILPYLM